MTIQQTDDQQIEQTEEASDIEVSRTGHLQEPEATILPDEEAGPKQKATDSVGADEHSQDQAPETSNAEAKKYRLRLRETETERDQLAATVTSLRRSIIDAQSEAAGLKPEALWAAGTTVDALLDDEGLISSEKVIKAVHDAQKLLGIRRFQGSADQGGYKASTPVSRKPTWGSLFKDK